MSAATVVSSRVEVDTPGIGPRQTVSFLVAVSSFALSDSSESPSLRALGAVAIEAPDDPTDDPTDEPTDEPPEDPRADPLGEPTADPLELGASDPSEALGTTATGVGSVDALDASVSRVETTS